MLNRTQPGTSVLKGNAQSNVAGGKPEPCILTWYDPALGGTNSSSGRADPNSKTASGEPYSPTADTCAAPPAYPFGTMITFSFGSNQISCRVNDRGGAIQGNHFDLSRHAAQALGIIGAGRVTGYFVVNGSSGATAAANAQGGPFGGLGGGTAPGGDVLSILSDLLTGNVQDLAVTLALAGVTVIKDIGLGIADYIVIPWWHWNQRAAQYYTKHELFTTSNDKWTTLPWTAAFWGLGYWLFWTDPDSQSLKPAPIRSSRAARHVRGLQAIPARRSLVKPKDVKGKTPTKPKPRVSTAELTPQGTMRVSRNAPVTVTGDNVTRSETRIEPTGEGSRRKGSPHHEGHSHQAHSAAREPKSERGTGHGSLPDSSGVTEGDTATRRKSRSETGRGAATDRPSGRDRTGR